MNRLTFAMSAVALALGTLGVTAAGQQPQPAPAQPKKETTVQGKLLHPVAAIGGETTGTVVETKKDGSYELDLKGNKELLKQVESLKGKEVKATGALRIVKGVEIPERKIITLAKIQEVKK